MSYQIGQYRFEGADSCLTDLTNNGSKLGYRASATSDGSFSDVVLRYDKGFETSKDYYLRVKVPQDMNYDITFNLKLMKKDSSDANEYQWLDSVTVNKAGTGEDSYRVVLYNKIDSNGKLCSPEDVAATVPLTYSSSVKSTFNQLYYDATSKTYYIGDKKGGYKDMDALSSPSAYNDMFITASWRQSYDADSYPCTFFELVFRPCESGFTDVVLEMVRTSDDYNIKEVDSSGTVTYGRVVPINTVTYELCEVVDLTSAINHSPLTKVGVWGHPGMIMSINGEQIKIGPSGYYELTVIPTESIGIVAHDYSENFSIDYTYEVAE